MRTILVTGATGRVGGEVVHALLAAGVEVRALVRAPGRANLPDGVDVRVGDLLEPASVAAAASGADGAFLLWPNGQAGDDEAEVAGAVVATLASTGQVVHLSARGVVDGPSDDDLGPILASHRRIERLGRQGGARWTSVRGGGFASNTLGWADDVRAGSVVREPFGGLPRPLVHERDLAAVAAVALLDGGLDGQTPEVTGPAVLTGQEQVDAIGAALGRSLRLEALDREQSIDRMTRIMGDAATARSMVDAWEQMVREPEQPTDTVRRVVGRPALTFSQWAEDHVDDFR